MSRVEHCDCSPMHLKIVQAGHRLPFRPSTGFTLFSRLLSMPALSWRDGVGAQIQHTK